MVGFVISERERFIVLVDGDTLKPSDAIVLLEGDGTSRVDTCVTLWEAGWAPEIVISGGVENPLTGCIHASKLQKRLESAGVPSGHIILEDRSMHTRHQAQEVLNIACANKWKRIILVASHYHQYRAYLTFLKVMFQAGLQLEIYNAPARDLHWFQDTGWGRRFDLLEKEFQKIKEYSALDHVATFEEAIEYQRQKECGLLM